MSFIAAGSYGCVFSPPLSCAAATASGTSKRSSKGSEGTAARHKASVASVASVGKVFADAREFASELRLDAIVAKIDKRDDFTLPVIDACTTEDVMRTPDIRKCKHMQPGANHRYKQIVYKHGGPSLKHVLATTTGSAEKLVILLHKLRPVIHGLRRVRDASYAHQDVKTDNILIGERHAYLIDFGIMTARSEIFNVKKVAALSHDYPYFPPEYKLWCVASKTSPVKGSREFERWYERNMSFNFIAGGHSVPLLRCLRYVGIDFATDVKALYDHKTPARNFTHLFSGKIDVFSMGMCLMMCLIWADARGPLWDSLRKLVVGMLCMDGEMRYTADTVVESFDRLLHRFELPVPGRIRRTTKNRRTL